MKTQLAFMLLFTIGLGVPKLKGQNLILKTKTGTEQAKPLSSLKLITFSNDNLLIDYDDASTESYSLSTISKLYFNSVSTGTANNLLDQGSLILSIYPNPANNVIYLQNAPDETSMVSIYRMDGVTVLQAQVGKDNKCIHVGNLAKGAYILKVNNQALKFIKL